MTKYSKYCDTKETHNTRKLTLHFTHHNISRGTNDSRKFVSSSQWHPSFKSNISKIIVHGPNVATYSIVVGRVL